MAIFLRRRVGVLGYVAEAGVVAQLSIQAIEDPNTPKQIYTQTQTYKHNYRYRLQKIPNTPREVYS